MSHEFLDFIEDMLAAADKAEILVDGVTFEEFEADFRINFAVVRALEIIGEATKRMPNEIRHKYPALPWQGMAGMRDRVIHGYDIVDLQLVWDTVCFDLPIIKPQLQQILADYANLPGTN